MHILPLKILCDHKSIFCSVIVGCADTLMAAEIPPTPRGSVRSMFRRSARASHLILRRGDKAGHFAVIPTEQKCIPDYGGLSHDVRSGFECSTVRRTAGSGEKAPGFLARNDECLSSFRTAIATTWLWHERIMSIGVEDRMATPTVKKRTPSSGIQRNEPG